MYVVLRGDSDVEINEALNSLLGNQSRPEP